MIWSHHCRISGGRLNDFNIPRTVTAGALVLLRAGLGWVLYKHEQKEGQVSLSLQPNRL